MTIRAVSFDADQTLWDYSEVQVLSLDSTIRVMESEGIVSPGSVQRDQLRRIRDVVANEVRGRPHTLEHVREESFVRFLRSRDHLNPEATGSRLAQHFLAARFNHIRLYPDVTASISRLKNRYLIGLLTNGNTYPDRCGLPDTFDAEVMGPSHGFEKPETVAFETVAALLGVDLCEMVHVGDDWDDIEGANRAGCVSVLIDRNSKRPNFARDAHHIVTDLNELESLLGEIS